MATYLTLNFKPKVNFAHFNSKSVTFCDFLRLISYFRLIKHFSYGFFLTLGLIYGFIGLNFNFIQYSAPLSQKQSLVFKQIVDDHLLFYEDFKRKENYSDLISKEKV